MNFYKYLIILKIACSLYVNVVPQINKCTKSQLKSLLIITAFILTTLNLNRHKPNILKCIFRKKNMIKVIDVGFFFSQLSLPIYGWRCNSWCNEYSRESASSISCYRGGVFNCWQNMRLTIAPIWQCNQYIHRTFCNKHCFKMFYLK